MHGFQLALVISQDKQSIYVITQYPNLSGHSAQAANEQLARIFSVLGEILKVFCEVDETTDNRVVFQSYLVF